MTPVGTPTPTTSLRRDNLQRMGLTTDEPSVSTPFFYTPEVRKNPMKSSGSYKDYSDYTIIYKRGYGCKYSLYTNRRGQVWSGVGRCGA